MALTERQQEILDSLKSQGGEGAMRGSPATRALEEKGLIERVSPGRFRLKETASAEQSASGEGFRPQIPEMISFTYFKLDDLVTLDTGEVLEAGPTVVFRADEEDVRVRLPCGSSLDFNAKELIEKLMGLMELEPSDDPPSDEVFRNL